MMPEMESEKIQNKRSTLGGCLFILKCNSFNVFLDNLHLSKTIQLWRVQRWSIFQKLSQTISSPFIVSGRE